MIETRILYFIFLLILRYERQEFYEYFTFFITREGHALKIVNVSKVSIFVSRLCRKKAIAFSWLTDDQNEDYANRVILYFIFLLILWYERQEFYEYFTFFITSDTREGRFGR